MKTESMGIEVSLVVTRGESGDRTYGIIERHHIEGSLWTRPVTLYLGHDENAALIALRDASKAAIAEDIYSLTGTQ